MTDNAQARRQFNVCDDPLLRYKYLNAFDAAMNNLEAERGWLASPQAFISLKVPESRLQASLTASRTKAIVSSSSSERACSSSSTSRRTRTQVRVPAVELSDGADYRVGVEEPGEYKIVLCSDDAQFGGHSRVDHGTHFFTVRARQLRRLTGQTPMEWNGRRNFLQIYLVSLSAVRRRQHCSADDHSSSSLWSEPSARRYVYSSVVATNHDGDAPASLLLSDAGRLQSDFGDAGAAFQSRDRVRDLEG